MHVIQRLLLFAATLGPIGYMPIAPGTFGTLAGLCIVWFIPLPAASHIAVILTGSVIGAIAATSAEKQLKQKDSSRIVADEFVGFYTATAFVPHTPSLLVAAFIIFRFFDITKPLMIRRIERTFKGGFGVMADDIAAGLYSNILIQAWLLLPEIVK